MKLGRFLIGMVLVCVLLSLPLVLAGITHAEDQAVNNPEILAKLDQILSGQKALMDQMASIREELNIIKIRVTQQQ